MSPTTPQPTRWLVLTTLLLTTIGLLITLRPPVAAQTPSPATETDTLISATETISVSLATVATGFTEPVVLANAGDARLFVGERAGVIYEMTTTGMVTPTPFLDIRAQTGSIFFQQGLMGLTFHPDYANNGYLFVNYTDLNGDTVISRFTYSPSLGGADPASELVILMLTQPFDDNNGGAMAFGADGYLYIAVGDGGGDDDPSGVGQDLTQLLGKFLRLDVDGGGLPPECSPSTNYTIPADNPYVGVNGCDEIWSQGWRNPWRFSFDRLTGDLFVGDVGASTAEEISWQSATSMGGENYGWSCYEGNQFGPNYNVNTCTATYTAPIHEVLHPTGAAIIAGYTYRGCAYPDLNGVYFFADFAAGTVSSLTSDSMGGWQADTLLTFAGQFTTFGEDSNGELYLADFSSGTISQLQSIAPPIYCGGTAYVYLPIARNE